MASMVSQPQRRAERGRRRKGLAIVCAGIAGLLLAMLASMIGVPNAVAAEAVDKCVPNAEHGCVSGILQTQDKTPIPDVTVTLGGEEEATATTAEDAEKYKLGESGATVEIAKKSFSKQRAVVRFDKAAAGSAAETESGNADSAKSGEQTAANTAQAGDDGKGSGFWSRFWQQLYSGCIFGLMLGLMAVGMNLVYGTTGLSSFSHGEQVTLGGLMAYVGTQMLHMPVVLSAIFAVAIGALAGWVQNQLVWAPLRHKRVGVMQQMIVTIGLSMALQYIYQFFFGGDIKGIVKSVPEGIQLGPIVTNAPTLIAAAIALVTIVSVTVFLYCTRLGRATRAVSDNAALAAASGINVDSVVRIVWILSCGLAALSGVLIGIHLNGIAWNTGVTLLMLMFAAVTLGGLGTANGALVGALIVGIVADMSTLVIPSDMRYASALAILILVLLIRPQGIFGKQKRVG